MQQFRTLLAPTAKAGTKFPIRIESLAVEGPYLQVWRTDAQQFAGSAKPVT